MDGRGLSLSKTSSKAPLTSHLPRRNGNFHFGNLQVEISVNFHGNVHLHKWNTIETMENYGEIYGNFHRPLWKFPFLTRNLETLKPFVWGVKIRVT